MTKVSQIIIMEHKCNIIHMVFLLMVNFMYIADPSLMLSLTVDDHSQRLEKLEGTLARMEMLGKY